MPPKVKSPLEKVTLNLFVGDKDTLQSFFPAKGYSVALRELIHNICRRLRESDSQKVLGGAEPLDVEIPLEDLKLD